MSLHSEQINELMAALAKAQGKIVGARADSSNPHFRSKYADLASVWMACRVPLESNGIAISQVPTTVDGKQMLVTILGHSSGQWIQSSMELPIQKAGPQELGSCLSYCRRYALAAMVGIYQDDDDAEMAQKPHREEVKQEAERGADPKELELLAEFKKEVPEIDRILKTKFGIERAEDVTSKHVAYARAVVQNRRIKEKEHAGRN